MSPQIELALVMLIGIAFGLLFFWIVKKRDLKLLQHFMMIKYKEIEGILMFLKDRELDSLSYYAVLHGLNVCSMASDVQNLWHSFDACWGEKLRVYDDKYSKLQQLIEAKWDELVRKEFSKANSRDEILSVISITREKSQVFTWMIGEIIKKSEFISLGFYISHLISRARSVLELREMKEFQILVKDFISKASNADELWNFERNIVPYVGHETLNLFLERLAVLEERSDYLSSIMGFTHVTTPAWKIAFEKLNKMKDPALESSDTHAAI